MSNSSLDVIRPEYGELHQYEENVNRIFMYTQIFITVVGIFGNILVLIVINRKALKDCSSAVFITYMAIFDTGVLLDYATTVFVYLHLNVFVEVAISTLGSLSRFCANWILAIIALGISILSFKISSLSLSLSVFL